MDDMIILSFHKTDILGNILWTIHILDWNDIYILITKEKTRVVFDMNILQ